MKAIIIAYADNTPETQANYTVFDGSNSPVYFGTISVDVSTSVNNADVQSKIAAAVAADAGVHGQTVAASEVLTNILNGTDVKALIAAAAPKAYQTIVSQTGTAAPAVAGGLTPMNSYPAGTTFTWARTGAGVYTLTASAAVFDTSGKTSVFMGALNNLNGAWKAVVSSTTVITFTTAVQSLAVLGLLGFTATPTDALLTQTLIEVRTYA